MPISRKGFGLSPVLLTETIRSIEEEAPLEDSEAMRHALHNRSGNEERVIERALSLSRRLKMDRELERWRGLASYVGLALSVLVFFIAYGIAASVVGADRSLNVVLAFFVALGLHAVTLAIWLIAVAASAWSRRPGTLGTLSLGGLLLRLVAWLPVDRSPHSLTMLSTANSLLQRAKLLPWAFGFISHIIWAAALLLVIVALGFAFSFREYRLTWETTILGADFFVRFVQITGWLPHMLGFPLPDTATLLNPAAPASDQRAWAWWLIGCTVVYGLLPRLVLAAVSWYVWRRRTLALGLDTTDPYFRKLLTRFAEMEPSVVVDHEHRPEPVASNIAVLPRSGQADSLAIIGFELPANSPWPPENLGEEAAYTTRISGSSEERRALLDTLARISPQKILIVCNPASSPDRGTERFIREACTQGAQCGLLLQPSPDGQAGNPQRWQVWLERSDMKYVPAFTTPAGASNWIGAHV